MLCVSYIVEYVEIKEGNNLKLSEGISNLIIEQIGKLQKQRSQ
jgi:hypothetical protein